MYYLIGLITGIVFYGFLAWMLMRRQIASGARRLRNLPRSALALIVVVAIIATVEAQKSGTNGTNNASGGTNLMMNAGHNLPHPSLINHAGFPALPQGIIGATTSQQEIDLGYRYAYTTNDADHSFAMPTNAVYLGNSHVHGARSDFGRNVVNLGDWSFPFGSNDVAYSTFWYFIKGYIKTSPFSDRGISAADYDDVLLVQGESSIWCATGADDEMIFTWQNIFPNGDTNNADNLQIVLRKNGDFETWSNEVCNAYSRIDPYDWDGDGLINGIDPAPATYDGELFGTGVAWLNANCGNVLSAVEGPDGEPIITWNTNSNENAYYWIHFTAQQDGTHISIECDGDSLLGDLDIIANSNTVCSVPLLMGAEYSVNSTYALTGIYSDNPMAVFDFSGISYDFDSSSFSVVVPVSLSLEEDDGVGSISTDPDVGATISSISGNCGDLTIYGSNYVWQSENCNCSGFSQWWSITVTWEEYCKTYLWEMQCEHQRENEEDPQSWASLSVPFAVMTGAEMGCITIAFYPPASATNATASLSMNMTGTGRVSHWTSTNKAVSVGLPFPIFPGVTMNLFVEGLAGSTNLGDVEYYLDVCDGTESYVITQALTVAQVMGMNMSSQQQGSSPNPPPFSCGVDYQFCETNSLNPDKHLVIPYNNVFSTLDSTIMPYGVNLELIVRPNLQTLWGDSEWQIIEARPQMSGTLVSHGGLSAHFEKPELGGVYRIEGRAAGSPWVEGTIVLPLSGASVDQRMVSDLALADVFCIKVAAKYPTRGQYSAKNGWDWFYAAGAGDYLGRVDNGTYKTVWYYNQVNDSGRGGCCTWHGYPIRNAKLSNFLIAYTCEKIGVKPEDMQTARNHLGHPDDVSATLSWNAGIAVAKGTNYLDCVTNMVRAAFLSHDGKSEKLWPNMAPADNHYPGIPYISEFDPDHIFLSPGFLYSDP